MDLMAGLVMDTGLWADSAEPWQVADARAVFARTVPMHWHGRPRGGRKSADGAGYGVSLHLTQAPPGATSYVVAADSAQAGLVLDSVRGFILRAPALRKVMRVEARRVVFLADREPVSTIEVLPADEASSYGLRPWLLIADELAQWPESQNARGVWAACISALPKVEDSRLVVLTSAGSPTHWAHGVLEQAKRSGQWRVSEVPGPLPWIPSEVLEEQRSLLPGSLFARLHLNQWVQGEDRLTSPEQVAACVGHTGPLPPMRGTKYYAGLDVGLVADRTVLTVGHGEKRDGELVVVVDDQIVWQGTKTSPVDLGEVEEACREVHRRYRRATFIFDPWQSQHLRQRLKARSVRVEEFTFSSASVGRLALTLHRLLRQQLLDLPDDPELLDELASVVLRETAPGAYRIDTTGSGHDDRCISLALVAQKLASQSVTGGRLHVAEGELPPIRLTRKDGPAPVPGEGPVPIKRRPDGTPPIPLGQAKRIGRFVVDRRFYSPPGRDNYR